ncbi:MAG TPA: hypothetical protein PLD87_09930 [Bacteroidia bacterium]|nr:hypothetical protein [Bacteroidia bacterium]
MQTVVLSITEKLKATQLDMDKLVREVANNFYVENLRRIHNTGKDVNERLIGGGNYSTKSTYVSLDQTPKKFTPIGKTGKSKFKSGKPHKSRFFPDGYKEFRQTIGAETSWVNLQLTGRLKTSFIIQNNGNKYLIGFDNQYGTEISEGMEKKYSQKIWGVSIEGAAQAQAIVKRYIDQHLKK